MPFIPRLLLLLLCNTPLLQATQGSHTPPPSPLAPPPVPASQTTQATNVSSHGRPGPGIKWRLVYPAIGRLFRTGFDLIYLVCLLLHGLWPMAGPNQQTEADHTSKREAAAGLRPGGALAIPGSPLAHLHTCTHTLSHTLFRPRSCRRGNAADDQRQKCSTGLVLVEPISSMTLLHPPCSCLRMPVHAPRQLPPRRACVSSRLVSSCKMRLAPLAIARDDTPLLAGLSWLAGWLAASHIHAII